MYSLLTTLWLTPKYTSIGWTDSQVQYGVLSNNMVWLFSIINLAQEAAKAVQENEYHILGNVHKELIISYVLDQFRTYQMIEKLLHIPTQFTEQWTFQLTPATQRILIEKYYEFKDNVIRELLGK